MYPDYTEASDLLRACSSTWSELHVLTGLSEIYFSKPLELVEIFKRIDESLEIDCSKYGLGYVCPLAGVFNQFQLFTWQALESSLYWLLHESTSSGFLCCLLKGFLICASKKIRFTESPARVGIKMHLYLRSESKFASRPKFRFYFSRPIHISLKTF